MASITTDKSGNRTVQYMGLVAGKRKRLSIRLGDVSLRDAEEKRAKIEDLNQAAIAGTSWKTDTALWVRTIDRKLYDKLAKQGLLPMRSDAEQTALGPFIDAYIAGRSDVEPSTRTVYGHTRRNLAEYFGEDRGLNEVTAAEADDWRRWLTRPEKDGGQALSRSTANRRCGIAKQYFRDAVRRRLIVDNPFAEMRGITLHANPDREHFVKRDVADKVLAACPDTQWQLLFALSRYGGLRCPSEHLALTWGDIEWDAGRFTVHSRKTKHHEGKAYRVVPLFPELRPYLKAAYDELLVDFDPKQERISEQPVINRYRSSETNLRTQLHRILKRAGVEVWPKSFQAMRSTRQTELEEQFPTHVVCYWMGNSPRIARKHYLQVTDSHFEQATAAKALQPMLPPVVFGGNAESVYADFTASCGVSEFAGAVGMGDEGLEPPTFAV